MSGTPTQLWQTFETVSRAVPSNVAIIYGETSLNYSDLRERCVTLANSWRDRAQTEQQNTHPDLSRKSAHHPYFCIGGMAT